MAITFNTPKALYLSQHPILIGATVTTADYVAFEVVINNEVIGSRLHIKPFNDAIEVDIQYMIHAALLESNQSFVRFGNYYQKRVAVSVICRAALVTDGTTGTFSTTSSFKVMLGEMDEHTDDFYTNFDNTNSFLTVYPDYEFINLGQEQFLSWINHFGSILVDAMTLSVVATYENGSTTTKDKAVNLAFEQYDVFIFNVNPEHLDIITTNLVKYTVQLIISPQLVSPIRTYIVSETPENYNDIVYFNNYFAPHVLRLKGNWSESIENQYTRIDGENGMNQYTEDSNLIYAAQSSFISKEASESLKWLYKKGKLWWYYNNRVVLMLLDRNKWNIAQTFKHLYTLILEMTAGHESKSISTKVITSDKVIDIPSGVTVTPPVSD